VGGPSRSTAQPVLGVVEVQVENVGPNAPVTPVTHHDCSFCHRLETPSFDVRYPTGTLTLPTISIFAYVPSDTSAYQVKTKRLRLRDEGTRNDGKRLGYYRVPPRTGG
jgi:hypothetical protein